MVGICTQAAKTENYQKQLVGKIGFGAVASLDPHVIPLWGSTPSGPFFDKKEVGRLDVMRRNRKAAEDSLSSTCTPRTRTCQEGGREVVEPSRRTRRLGDCVQ